MTTSSSFGRFQLLLRLGQGGMGEVWKAREQSSTAGPRELVIKRMLAHTVTNPSLSRQFEREARLCSQLNHPNIVRVFEFGQVGNEPYFAMEYVPGMNLCQLVAALGGAALAPGAACFVLASVCRALAYAWDAPGEDTLPLRLVHRDVTPSNVMLAHGGHVKLLDFGIAKALSELTESQTSTGTLKGKFGYMAPEQVEGARADHASDQFSVGVVLWEAVTGRRLFRGDTDLQTLSLVRAAVVTPPSQLQPGVPPELDLICLRALSREPQRRFVDCHRMAEALDAVARSEGWTLERSDALLAEAARAHQLPDAAIQVLELDAEPGTLARPVPTTYRLRRPTRAAAVLGASLVTLAGVVAFTVAHVRDPGDPPTPSPTHLAAPSSAPAAVAVETPPTLPPPTLPAPSSPVVTAPTPSVQRPTAPSGARRRLRGNDRPSAVHRPRAAAAPRAIEPARPTSKTVDTATKVRAGQVVDPFAQ